MTFERVGGALRATGVLGDDRARALLEAIAAERKWLVNASTGGRDDYREAQLLYTPPDEAAVVLEWLRSRVNEVCESLDVPRFTVSRTEMQVTIHGDGGFYKVHRDDQGEDVQARTLSYLYYLHREPRGFDGGALVLYGRDRVDIDPEHDSIVVFPSHIEHEVVPVRVASGELLDGRITINGWLWR